MYMTGTLRAQITRLIVEIGTVLAILHGRCFYVPWGYAESPQCDTFPNLMDSQFQTRLVALHISLASVDSIRTIDLWPTRETATSTTTLEFLNGFKMYFEHAYFSWRKFWANRTMPCCRSQTSCRCHSIRKYRDETSATQMRQNVPKTSCGSSKWRTAARSGQPLVHMRGLGPWQRLLLRLWSGFRSGKSTRHNNNVLLKYSRC